jgi:hypothetical protein
LSLLAIVVRLPSNSADLVDHDSKSHSRATAPWRPHRRIGKQANRNAANLGELPRLRESVCERDIEGAIDQIKHHDALRWTLFSRGRDGEKGKPVLARVRAGEREAAA